MDDERRKSQVAKSGTLLVRNKTLAGEQVDSISSGVDIIEESRPQFSITGNRRKQSAPVQSQQTFQQTTKSPVSTLTADAVDNFGANKQVKCGELFVKCDIDERRKSSLSSSSYMSTAATVSSANKMIKDDEKQLTLDKKPVDEDIPAWPAKGEHDKSDNLGFVEHKVVSLKNYSQVSSDNSSIPNTSNPARDNCNQKLQHQVAANLSINPAKMSKSLSQDKTFKMPSSVGSNLADKRMSECVLMSQASTSSSGNIGSSFAPSRNYRDSFQTVASFPSSSKLDTGAVASSSSNQGYKQRSRNAQTVPPPLNESRIDKVRKLFVTPLLLRNKKPSCENSTNLQQQQQQQQLHRYQTSASGNLPSSPTNSSDGRRRASLLPSEFSKYSHQINAFYKATCNQATKRPHGKQSKGCNKIYGCPLHLANNLAPITTFVDASDRCKLSQVPFIIARLCNYIENNSAQLTHEGIFRVSGNQKLIEKLRDLFNMVGDAPLELELVDVATAASLLKLYLRELPEPLIPGRMNYLFIALAKKYSVYLDYEHASLSNNYTSTSQFLSKTKQPNVSTANKSSSSTNSGNRNTYDNSKYSSNSDESKALIERQRIAFVRDLTKLIRKLPVENYSSLKYLACFLHRIMLKQQYNKMCAAALGIVFGPNIFRIRSESRKGLKEQTLSNRIMACIISQYKRLFDSELTDPLGNIIKNTGTGLMNDDYYNDDDNNKEANRNDIKKVNDDESSKENDSSINAKQLDYKQSTEISSSSAMSQVCSTSTSAVDKLIDGNQTQQHEDISSRLLRQTSDLALFTSDIDNNEARCSHETTNNSGDEKSCKDTEVENVCYRGHHHHHHHHHHLHHFHKSHEHDDGEEEEEEDFNEDSNAEDEDEEDIDNDEDEEEDDDNDEDEEDEEDEDESGSSSSKEDEDLDDEDDFYSNSGSSGSYCSSENDSQDRQFSPNDETNSNEGEGEDDCDSTNTSYTPTSSHSNSNKNNSPSSWTDSCSIGTNESLSPNDMMTSNQQNKSCKACKIICHNSNVRRRKICNKQRRQRQPLKQRLRQQRRRPRLKQYDDKVISTNTTTSREMINQSEVIEEFGGNIQEEVDENSNLIDDKQQIFIIDDIKCCEQAITESLNPHSQTRNSKRLSRRGLRNDGTKNLLDDENDISKRKKSKRYRKNRKLKDLDSLLKIDNRFGGRDIILNLSAPDLSFNMSLNCFLFHHQQQTDTNIPTVIKPFISENCLFKDTDNLVKLIDCENYINDVINLSNKKSMTKSKTKKKKSDIDNVRNKFENKSISIEDIKNETKVFIDDGYDVSSSCKCSRKSVSDDAHINNDEDEEEEDDKNELKQTNIWWLEANKSSLPSVVSLLDKNLTGDSANVDEELEDELDSSSSGIGNESLVLSLDVQIESLQRLLKILKEITSGNNNCIKKEVQSLLLTTKDRLNVLETKRDHLIHDKLALSMVDYLTALNVAQQLEAKYHSTTATKKSDYQSEENLIVDEDINLPLASRLALIERRLSDLKSLRHHHRKYHSSAKQEQHYNQVSRQQQQANLPTTSPFRHNNSPVKNKLEINSETCKQGISESIKSELASMMNSNKFRPDSKEDCNNSEISLNLSKIIDTNTTNSKQFETNASKVVISEHKSNGELKSIESPVVNNNNDLEGDNNSNTKSFDEQFKDMNSGESVRRRCRLGSLCPIELVLKIEKQLNAKRVSGCRQIQISNYNDTQLSDEKLELQKNLLRYEHLFGTPSNKSELSIVRHLYDRYKLVKSINNYRQKKLNASALERLAMPKQ